MMTMAYPSGYATYHNSVILNEKSKMIFKYKAYNTLLANLGRLDYVVEISEIAVSDFLQNLKSSKDEKAFLEKKSKEFGILVSLDKSNEFYNQITLGNISNVYHLSETFFYEMQSEFNTISNETWTFEQGKTKLDQVLKFLRDKNRINQTDMIDDYLIDTFKYYHQLRVYFSHKKTTSKSEIVSKRNKAMSHFDDKLLEKYRIKGGPKSLEEVDFEDYFLYTQIAKDLALKISSIGYPEAKGLASLSQIKSLKKFGDKNDRLKEAIKSELVTNFGYVKENDSDDLIEQIVLNL